MKITPEISPDSSGLSHEKEDVTMESLVTDLLERVQRLDVHIIVYQERVKRVLTEFEKPQ